MHIEDFRTYCLAKPHTFENFPFDEETLCLRVGGKIFAITGLNSERFTVNLKCDPDRAVEYRERYEGVMPGFHMNKKHWNTVDFQSDVPYQVLCELIDHSYQLVLESLPTKVKKELGI